ncbi:hypothetical protein P9139_01730 [Curtobacterium flaccumfaciens]|nr:hypothetical protein P9139_01730 [Curtobacterium flaccumfaciens]
MVAVITGMDSVIGAAATGASGAGSSVPAWRRGAACVRSVASGSWSRNAGPTTGSTAVVAGGSACSTGRSASRSGTPRCAARRDLAILTRTTTATIAQMPFTTVDGTAWCAATLTATASPPTRLKSW